jgi:hypothetical protein
MKSNKTVIFPGKLWVLLLLLLILTDRLETELRQ